MLAAERPARACLHDEVASRVTGRPAIISDANAQRGNQLDFILITAGTSSPIRDRPGANCGSAALG
jgi:hypothetical protein